MELSNQPLLEAIQLQQLLSATTRQFYEGSQTTREFDDVQILELYQLEKVPETATGAPKFASIWKPSGKPVTDWPRPWSSPLPICQSVMHLR